MALVAEFIHENGTDYGVPTSIVQEINESGTSGFVSSENSHGVSKVIQDTRKAGVSTFEQDLGFVTGRADVNSDIIKLLLKWSS